MVFCSGVVYADTEDLEQMVKNLNDTAVEVTIPKLPEYTPSNTNYKMISVKNLFTQVRLRDSAESNNILQNYTLNQLQVVGFMRQKNTDYAFIKTPFETLLVKTGDKIKLGNVVSITPAWVEIEELQVDNDKTYHKKVYLKFDASKDDNSLKLKL